MRKLSLFLLAITFCGMFTAASPSSASAESCTDRYNQCYGIGSTARERARRCAYLLNRCLRTGCFRIEGEWRCGFSRV